MIDVLIKCLVFGKLLVFFGVLMMTAISLTLGLLLFYPLRLLNYSLYREVIQISESVFASTCVILVFILAPSKLVVSGNHDLADVQVLMANHQIYPDWIYLWVYAWTQRRHSDIGIMLMNYLKYVPVFGWGTLLLDFIFLKQNWEIDRETISAHLNRVKDAKKPFWLLIFPEGTLNTPLNIEKSRKFAEKMSYKHPVHTLLPRSMGLHYCLSTLKPQSLVDVTVGYSGLKPSMIPYDEYLIENVFGRSIYPETIHLHFRTFKYSDIPGVTDSRDVIASEQDKQVFSAWLRERYYEKDAMLKDFFENGYLDKNSRTIAIEPRLKDWLLVGICWYCSLDMIRIHWICLSWLIRILFRLFFH